MSVPTTFVDALVATAFLFYGHNFITLGMMGLGKGKAEGSGTVFLFNGIINAILAFIILGLNITKPILVSTAFLVLIFAFTWITAGIINIRGYGLKPLGNASIISGLMMLSFIAFYVINGGAVFSTIGWVWLTVNVASWAWAFWSVTLASYGKIPMKVMGWTFLIQAFYTLWLPAALLLPGAFSLLP